MDKKILLIEDLYEEDLLPVQRRDRMCGKS